MAQKHEGRIPLVDDHEFDPPRGLDTLERVSLSVSGVKCFRQETEILSTVRRVNVIIGRNNSGKSSILDALALALPSSLPADGDHHRPDPAPRVDLRVRVSKKAVLDALVSESLGSELDRRIEVGREAMLGQLKRAPPVAQFYRERGRESWRPLGLTIEWAPACSGPLGVRSDLYAEKLRSFIDGKPFGMRPPPAFADRQFYRMAADRRLKPEQTTYPEDVPHPRPNGDYVTELLNRYLNDSGPRQRIVEGPLLDGLNEIYRDHVSFSRIQTQRRTHGSATGEFWEVHLDSDGLDAPVSLTNSGAGLQTILMVLCYIHLIPDLEGSIPSRYAFGFEELENNLHPHLLRNLLTYLNEKSKNEGFLLFLTTHSNVMIDFFAGEEDAQLLHVRQQDGVATVETVEAYAGKNAVLDDLGARASDLLQANGVIWVEGPSDRIYLNHWIKLWSDGELRERVHYQIVFYGGRVLSNFSAAPPAKDEVDELVSMLSVNRNAAILMDSDIKSDDPEAKINATKQRVVNEFESLKPRPGFTWVTEGREIENYVPAEAMKALVKSAAALAGPQQYSSAIDYLKRLKREGTKVPALDDKNVSKTKLAAALIEHITLADARTVLDLDARMTELVSVIRGWNGEKDADQSEKPRSATEPKEM